MEYTNFRDCSTEVAIKLLGKITLELPELEVDLSKQLDIKRVIDEVLYQYQINSKETALVKSDIDAKVNYFLATKKLEGLSNRTLQNYKYKLDKLCLYFNKPISTITNADIKMFMYTNAEGKQENSLNTFMTPIRLFFAWCQNEEFIIKNPCASLKTVKEPKRMRKPLNIEQLEILRDSLTSLREKALFEFMISTGCRLNEVCNVKISDLNFNAKTLLVIGKGNKERKVYFTERCKRALINYINSRTDENSWLFVSERRPYGKLSPRAVQSVVIKMKKKSGLEIKIHPHIFRHTFATHALNSGMKLEVVQAILGHENASTTQIYAKLQDSNIEHSYRQLIS